MTPGHPDRHCTRLQRWRPGRGAAACTCRVGEISCAQLDATWAARAARDDTPSFANAFGGFAAAAERIEVTEVRLHQTDDPDVVFVEEHMVADLRTGQHYENDLAIRVTFRDGLIHDMFEYYGQAAHQRLADIVLAGATA